MYTGILSQVPHHSTSVRVLCSILPNKSKEIYIVRGLMCGYANIVRGLLCWCGCAYLGWGIGQGHLLGFEDVSFSRWWSSKSGKSWLLFYLEGTNVDCRTLGGLMHG